MTVDDCEFQLQLWRTLNATYGSTPTYEQTGVLIERLRDIWLDADELADPNDRERIREAVRTFLGPLQDRRMRLR